MSNNSASEVKKGLSSFDFFTIGFGAIVGVGWALSLNNWMANSGGPVPAAVGYLMVLVILTPVALCYCELTPMLPVASGRRPPSSPGGPPSARSSSCFPGRPSMLPTCCP